MSTVSEIKQKYALDNASYRGATVSSVLKKIKSGISKFKASNVRTSPFGGLKFMAGGRDFEINPQGQSGDPSHIDRIVVAFRGPNGMEREGFDAFGQEQSAIAKTMDWISKRIK